MKITKEEIIKYLAESPCSEFDHNGNPEYFVYLDTSGNLTHDSDNIFAGYVAPTWESLGYKYYWRLQVVDGIDSYPDRMERYDEFVKRYGNPLDWLDKIETDCSQEFISEVVIPLMEQVNKCLDEEENDD